MVGRPRDRVRRHASPGRLPDAVQRALRTAPRKPRDPDRGRPRARGSRVRPPGASPVASRLGAVEATVCTRGPGARDRRRGHGAGALVALGVYGLLEYVGSRDYTSRGHTRVRPADRSQSSTIPPSCSTSAPASERPVLRQGIDFPELEQLTKIRPKYLRALEDENFDILPAPTYVKGFLRSYAESLGLDGQPFVDEYNSRFAVGDEERRSMPAATAPAPRATGRRANRASRCWRCSVSRCSRRS